MNYGFPAHSDEEYLSAVIPLMKQARVSALLLPGIGTVDHPQWSRRPCRFDVIAISPGDQHLPVQLNWIRGAFEL